MCKNIQNVSVALDPEPAEEEMLSDEENSINNQNIEPEFESLEIEVVNSEDLDAFYGEVFEYLQVNEAVEEVYAESQIS